MKNFIFFFKLLLLLIPLGILIRFIDLKLIDGFLSSNVHSKHYIFIGGLFFVLFTLIIIITYLDKHSNK